MTCPHCKTPDVPSEAKFCPYCGKKIEAPKPKKTDKTPRLIVETSGDAAIRPVTWFFDKINLVSGVNELPLSLNADLRYGFKFRRNPQNVLKVDMEYFETPFDLIVSNIFKSCSSLSEINLAGLDGVRIGSTSVSVFEGCEALTQITLPDWDTSKVTSLSGFFSGCKQLRKVNLDKIDTSSCQSLLIMFNDCESLENIDLTSWNTESVLYTNYMFKNCSSLKTIDLSNFRTPRLQSIAGMFDGCVNLRTIDMSGISFANVPTNTEPDKLAIFNGCKSLEKVYLRGCGDKTVDIVERAIQISGTGAKIFR